MARESTYWCMDMGPYQIYIDRKVPIGRGCLNVYITLDPACYYGTISVPISVGPIDQKINVL